MRPARLIPILALLVTACGQPATAASQDRSRLAGLDQALQRLAAQVNDSVVRIHAIGYAPVTGSAATPTSLLARRRQVGSGVVVGDGGLVVTNYHVVAGAARIWAEVPARDAAQDARHSVLGAPYERVSVELLGADGETDLALLRLARADLTPLPLGDSEALDPGQIVVAFGSPLGLEGSVSMGVVSAVARQLTPDSPVIFIQTDAAINPGSSGGPLVTLSGQVVGINTLVLSRSGGNEGIGLAVPSNIVGAVVEQIAEHGRVRRGVLGLHVQTITPAIAEALELPQRWGVLVSDVDPNGPAFSAGLRPGDVIERLGDRVMENARQFNVNVYGRAVGGTVELRVRRGEERSDVAVAVVERLDPPVSMEQLADPRRQTIERLGVVAVDLTPAFAARIPRLREPRGVLVVTGAGDTGFQPGDVIHAVGRREVRTFEALEQAVRDVPSGVPLVVRIERLGVYHFVEVPDA
ncbi:MAG: trypsin-like peptidase domain-containing protein [Sandaracinaceae bacterium]